MEGKVYEIPEVTTISNGLPYIPMTEKALRWALFSNDAFREKCSRKLGRRRYILPREILSFIKNQPAQGGTHVETKT